MKKANRFAKKVLALFSSACVLLMCFSALGTVAFADDISGESQSVTEPETETSESSETSEDSGISLHSEEEVTTPTYKVWDGKSDTVFEGKGTAANPYQISTPQELYGLVYQANRGQNSGAGKYYVLTNDIYLNDINQDNWQDKANIWGTTWTWKNSFGGYFDGQGHTIYGIYYDESNDANFTGLFGCLGIGAKISNVHIRNSVIRTTRNDAGAIAGSVDTNPDIIANPTVIISGCSVDNTVTITAQNAGGFLGNARAYIRIYNCYSTADITGLTQGYGIYGRITSHDYTQISNFYTNSSPVNDAQKGNINCTNVYTTKDTTLTTKITKVPALTKAYMPGLDDKNIWTETDDSSAPTLVTDRHNGDVNLDGSANAVDITALKKQLLGVENTYSANVNRDDNVVDICDLVQLNEYLNQALCQ